MGTAKTEIEKAKRGEGCLGKAHPDEPVFILRAQDLHAPYAVRHWIEAAAVMLGYDHPKVQEAMQLASDMEKWPRRKLPD